MATLWRRDEATKEGKYPIVLRRDGKPVTDRHFVMLLRDPCVAAALRAYAEEASRRGLDEEWVADVVRLAQESDEISAAAMQDETRKKPDPDKPPHRKDDPATLAWARSIGCPSS